MLDPSGLPWHPSKMISSMKHDVLSALKESVVSCQNWRASTKAGWPGSAKETLWGGLERYLVDSLVPLQEKDFAEFHCLLDCVFVDRALSWQLRSGALDESVYLPVFESYLKQRASAPFVDVDDLDYTSAPVGSEVSKGESVYSKLTHLRICFNLSLVLTWSLCVMSKSRVSQLDLSLDTNRSDVDWEIALFTMMLDQSAISLAKCCDKSEDCAEISDTILNIIMSYFIPFKMEFLLSHPDNRVRRCCATKFVTLIINSIDTESLFHISLTSSEQKDSTSEQLVFAFSMLVNELQKRIATAAIRASSTKVAVLAPASSAAQPLVPLDADAGFGTLETDLLCYYSAVLALASRCSNSCQAQSRSVILECICDNLVTITPILHEMSTHQSRHIVEGFLQFCSAFLKVSNTCIDNALQKADWRNGKNLNYSNREPKNYIYFLLLQGHECLDILFNIPVEFFVLSWTSSLINADSPWSNTRKEALIVLRLLWKLTFHKTQSISNIQTPLNVAVKCLTDNTNEMLLYVFRSFEKEYIPGVVYSPKCVERALMRSFKEVRVAEVDPDSLGGDMPILEPLARGPLEDLLWLLTAPRAYMSRFYLAEGVKSAANALLESELEHRRECNPTVRGRDLFVGIENKSVLYFQACFKMSNHMVAEAALAACRELLSEIGKCHMQVDHLADVTPQPVCLEIDGAIVQRVILALLGDCKSASGFSGKKEPSSIFTFDSSVNSPNSTLDNENIVGSEDIDLLSSSSWPVRDGGILTLATIVRCFPLEFIALYCDGVESDYLFSRLEMPMNVLFRAITRQLSESISSVRENASVAVLSIVACVEGFPNDSSSLYSKSIANRLQVDIPRLISLVTYMSNISLEFALLFIDNNLFHVVGSLPNISHQSISVGDILSSKAHSADVISCIRRFETSKEGVNWDINEVDNPIIYEGLFSTVKYNGIKIQLTKKPSRSVGTASFIPMDLLQSMMSRTGLDPSSPSDVTNKRLAKAAPKGWGCCLDCMTVSDCHNWETSETAVFIIKHLVLNIEKTSRIYNNIASQSADCDRLYEPLLLRIGRHFDLKPKDDPNNVSLQYVVNHLFKLLIIVLRIDIIQEHQTTNPVVSIGHSPASSSASNPVTKQSIGLALNPSSNPNPNQIPLDRLHISIMRQLEVLFPYIFSDDSSSSIRGLPTSLLLSTSALLKGYATSKSRQKAIAAKDLLGYFDKEMSGK